MVSEVVVVGMWVGEGHKSNNKDHITQQKVTQQIVFGTTRHQDV
jgi:hypothetical protein